MDLEPTPDEVTPEEVTPEPERSEGQIVMGRISRKGFLWAGAAVMGAYGAGHWLFSRREAGGTQWPFRRGLEANEGFWSDTFSEAHKARTFSEKDVQAERQNGDDGLDEDYDPSTWSLSVMGVNGQEEPITVTMEELQKFPHTEMITELCCIEGWSVVQKWKGVRLIDFAKKYPPPTVSGGDPDFQRLEDLVPYVAMETPDAGYYVGLDMYSALHPQTLLCWEMNGHPLTLDHGAPLRLVIPVKYGIKNIKRLAKITYTTVKPKDFWAEQGYDWFAGL